MKADLLHKNDSFFREGEDVKFAILDAEKATVPVAQQCRLLGVSRSGFYASRR